MIEKEQSAFDLKQMVADYMEKGLLDNIVSMFKADKTAYPLIGELITDERVRVRLGVTALMEILVEEDPDNVGLALESIIKTLSHELPNIRGDAANLLAIIGSKEVIPHLQALKDKDEDKAVREMAAESLEHLQAS